MSATLAKEVGPQRQPMTRPRRLRIAAACGSYVPQRDGISVYTENLLARLVEVAASRRLALTLDVYACGRAAPVMQSMLEQYLGRDTGTTQYRVLPVTDESMWGRYVTLPRRIRRNGPYDGVFLPNLQPVWMPGQSTVAVLHDLTYRVASAHFPRWRVWYMDLLTRWHLRTNQAMALISRSSEDDLSRCYPRAARSCRLFLPNGLPEKLSATQRLPHAEAQAQLAAQHLHLLFVGRLNRLKGFDRVRRVCQLLDRSLAASGRTASVHLVGKDTPETAELMASLDALEHVEIIRHGYLDDAELNDLYRRCAYCLFLSRNEGFGLPLMEAIWQRCVPLLSDIAIFREIMGPDYPLFEGNDHGLTELTRFVERMGEDGAYRRAILAQADNTLSRWQDGYQKAAANLLDWMLGQAAEVDERVSEGQT